MIKKVIFTFFSRFMTALLSLGIAVIVSKLLGAEGRGNQALLIANIAFITHLLGVLGSEGISIMHARNRRYEYLWISYLWIALCLTIFIITTIFIPNIDTYIWHIALISTLIALGTANMAIYVGNEKVNFFNLLQLITPALTVGLILTSHFVFDNFSFDSYITILYISHGLVWLISFYKFKLRSLFDFKGFSNRFLMNCRFMFKYGFNRQLAAMIQLLGIRGSFYIINIYIDGDSVGYYANAVAITEALWIISKSMGFIMFSKFINTQNTRQIRKILKRFLVLNFAFLLFCSLFVSLIPNFVYTNVFGKDFSNLRLIIITLLPGAILYGQYYILANYFSGVRLHYVNTYSSLVGSLVLIILGLWLTPLWGIKGVIIATTLSYCAVIAIQDYFLRKKITLNVFKNSLDYRLIFIFIRYAKRSLFISTANRNLK